MFPCQDANGVDLSQFERWYSQAGTPVVEVHPSYNEANSTLTLTLKQYTPATPGQPMESKLPLMIPLKIGLISVATGREIGRTITHVLRESEEMIHLGQVKEPAVISTLRDFSAPVRIKLSQTDKELALLMAKDTDSFNRWDASNRLSTKIILDIANLPLEEIPKASLPSYYLRAMLDVVVSFKVRTHKHT